MKKIKKMKKGMLRIFTMCLSLSVVLSTILVPEIFAFAEGNAYNAQLLNMPEHSSSAGYEYTVEAESTALTPEINGVNLTLNGWSGASTSNNTTSYMYITTYDGAGRDTTDKTYSFKENQAMMFYVKTAVGTPANELFLQYQTSTRGDEATYGARQWMTAKKSTNIYYLPIGDTEWSSMISPTSHVDSSKGNIIIPSGFEGWIRIPYTSTYSKEGSSTEICRINIYLKGLGGKYTANDISIGSFMIIDQENENFTDISLGGVQKTLLVEMPCHNTHLLKPQTVNGATVTENESVISSGYTYSLSGTTADFTVNDSTPVEESIMSYIRLPLEGDSKVSLKINGKAFKKDSELFALDRGNFAFESVTVDDSGAVTLPDGFEGYLLVPSVSYDRLSGQAVSNVSFEFEKSGASFGCVMLSDNANPEVIIRMDSDKAPVYLIKDAYYKGTMLETEDDTASNIADNNYYNVGSKVTDKSFSIGIDDGYYYEMSVGSAAEGEYKLGSNVPASYTGTAANGITVDKRPTDSNNPPLAVSADKANNLMTVSVNSAVETDGVYEIASASALTGTYAIAKYAAATAPTLETTGSLMFYVKHNDATQPLKMVVGHGWKLTRQDSNYYLLPSGAATWQERTTEDVATAGGNWQGYIEIPADFEGWVRIPASILVSGNDVKYTTATVTKELYIFPKALGGDYGTLTIGKFITVAESEKNYTSIILGSEEISLVPSSKAYTATAANGITVDKRPTDSNNPPLAVSADKANNLMTVSVNSAVETDGVYEIASASALTGTYAIAKYAAATAPTLETTGSLMFYVKHNNATQPLKMVVGHGWKLTRQDSNYYLLPKGAITWQTYITEDVATAGGNWQGYIEIPADFEGWVRIPASILVSGNDVKYTTATVTKELYIFPKALGGDYGTLTFGKFTTVKETDDRVFFNYGDDVKVPLSSNIEVSEEGNYFKVSIGTALNEKVFTTDAASVDLYSEISLKNAVNITTDDAFMFYVRQSGRTASQFNITLGDAGMKMQAGAKYQIYDSEYKTWTEKTALDDGRIEFAGGFSGWVRIPYNSLTNSAGEVDPDGFSIEKVLVTPCQLGSSYGTLKVGSFLVVNHGAEQLVTMRVNKGLETPITVREAYTAITLVPDAILGSGTNARSVIVEKEKWPILEGGYLYNVASTYNTVSMDSTSSLDVGLTETVWVEGQDGLIMYVSIPETKDNAVILGGVFKTAAGAQYYTLNAGNDSVWETKTANSNGSMPIPAGFDGYIRVPFSSMVETPTDEINNFIFGFSKIGEEYGEPIFGTFMISDNTDYNFTNVFVDVLDYSQSLIQPDYYEGYVLQGEAVAEGGDNRITVSSGEGNVLTPDIPEGYSYKVTSTDGVIELGAKEYTPRLTFKVDEMYRSKLSPSGAVMFYIDISNYAENTLYLQAIGDITAATAAGSRFSVLQDGNSYWEEQVANGNGDLTFTEGFKGWVRIPFTSLKNSKGVAIKDSIKQLYFTFKNVGGSYGEPQIASVMMLSNNGNFGKLKLSGHSDLISLYGTNGETVYSRDDIAIWESVIDPLIAYSDGEAIALSPSIDKEVENEVNTVFSGKVVTGVTPFDAKGIEYSSTNTVNNHGDHLPRVQVATPFTVRDSVGVVVYITIPDNGEEVNSVFFQMKTADGRWLSVKKEFMLPTLSKGETEWKNVFVNKQRVQFASGFEGYIYIPNEAFVTHPNASTGEYTSLGEVDVVTHVIIGIDEYGGETGSFTVGGIFLSKNGVLSHNGAYVDGDTVCRDVFLGTVVSEDTVRYSIYDAPSEVGDGIRDLPTPTAPDYLVDKDKMTAHSVDIFFDAYPGANRYRCDVYKIVPYAEMLNTTYYEFAGSTWTTDTKTTIDGLTTGVYYTIVVIAFKDNTGLAIYALCPVRLEGEIVGDMYITDNDPFEYDWFKGSSPDEDEWEYEIIYEEVDGEEVDGESDSTKTERVKKMLRRRKTGGMQTWLIIVIIVAAVVVVAAAAVVTIILIKRKRRKS